MSITVRAIQEEDLELIMQWRMDPDITRYMNTNPKLTLEGQRVWLKSITASTTSRHWLIEQDDVPVGVINLIDMDEEHKTSSWGYYIGEKSKRSLKLAISLEMSLYDYVFDVLNYTELHNEVFSLNEGVIKLHQACGSHITKEVKGAIVKEGVAYDITHMRITKEEWDQRRWKSQYERVNYDIILVPHHIGYAVADIEKAIIQFRRMGYYQTSPICEDKDRNVRIAFMESYEGGYQIEIISPMSDKSPVSDTLCRMKKLSSPYHICYEVESIEDSIKILKKRGFVMTQAAAPAAAIENRQVVFMLNREAGLIELVEKEKP